MRALQVCGLVAFLATIGVACQRTDAPVLSNVTRAADSEEIDIIVIVTDNSFPADARAGIDQLKIKMGDKVLKQIVMINGPKGSTSIQAPEGKKYIIQDVNRLKIVSSITGVKVEGTREK